MLTTYLGTFAATTAATPSLWNYQGTAFNVSFVLSATAGILMSAAMLRSTIFGKLSGYLGLAGNAAALGLFAPVVGAAVAAFPAAPICLVRAHSTALFPAGACRGNGINVLCCLRMAEAALAFMGFPYAVRRNHMLSSTPATISSVQLIVIRLANRDSRSFAIDQAQHAIGRKCRQRPPNQQPANHTLRALSQPQILRPRRGKPGSSAGNPVPPAQ